MVDFDKLVVDFDELVPRHLQRIGLDQMQADAALKLLDFGPDRSVSLAHRDTPVKNQDGPKCTAYAVVAALENSLRKEYDLSEAHLWKLQGARQNIDAAVLAASKWIATEEDREWKGRFKLSRATFIGFDWIKLTETIDGEKPLVVALNTPRDLGGPSSVILPGALVTRGGHAMAVVGYRVLGGARYFLVKNSWGETGDLRGYYWIAWDLYPGANGRYALFYSCDEVEDRNAGGTNNV